MMMSLSADDTDTLKKKLQTLLEEAASSLGNMIGLNINLQPLDFVDNPTLGDVPDFFQEEVPLLVQTSFRSTAVLPAPLTLLFKSQQAKVLANYMLGGSGVINDNPLSEMEQSAVGEAVNQMMNGAFFKLSSSMSQRVDVANATVTPFEGEEQLGNINANLLTQSVYSIHGNFTLTDNTTTDTLDFVLLLSLNWAEQFINLFTQVPETAPPPLFDISGIMAPGSTLESLQNAAQPAVVGASTVNSNTQPVQQPTASSYSSGSNSYAGATTPPPPSFNPYNPVQPNDAVTVQPVQFGTLESSVPTAPSYDQSNLNLMLDIKINLHVELGRTTMNIKEILELGRGAVLELDRLAGEPVDLFANGKLIARGEVVVIEDNFGLRVTNIVSPQERIRA
jgi:flagellar motor switch protein FliN/FliY